MASLAPTKRTRLPDWDTRLFTFLHDIRARPFVWGAFDCAVGLVGGAVDAQTGVDLTLQHLGAYGDEAAAMRYLRDNGWTKKGDDMKSRLTRMMDAQLRRETVGKRHRGNIVLLDSVDGAGFGIRVGADAVRLTPDGLKSSRIAGTPIEWTVT